MNKIEKERLAYLEDANTIYYNQYLQISRINGYLNLTIILLIILIVVILLIGGNR